MTRGPLRDGIGTVVAISALPLRPAASPSPARGRRFQGATGTQPVAPCFLCSHHGPTGLIGKPLFGLARWFICIRITEQRRHCPILLRGTNAKRIHDQVHAIKKAADYSNWKRSEERRV